MASCVRCGFENQANVENCGQCTWPFARSAWLSTTRKIRRLTLDTGCINAKGRDPDLNTLEKWQASGDLELQRSSAMLAELKGADRIAKANSLGPHPNLFTVGSSAIGGADVLAGPDLPHELQQVLFPTANPLTENQRNDIEHLRQHVRTGGDVFVTHNPNDFITRGRQETLASCGVWVLSPSEVVTLLRDLYGWS